MIFHDTSDLNDKEIYLQLNKTTDENKKKGYVPAYYFTIIRNVDSVEVGKCNLRVGHNENTKYGGNIGYEVFEEFRGNRYASKACQLLFLLAKKHKLNEVIITCAPDNTASRKTCEYSGAELMGIVNVPSRHEMYIKGRRRTCQYVAKL